MAGAFQTHNQQCHELVDIVLPRLREHRFAQMALGRDFKGIDDRDAASFRQLLEDPTYIQEAVDALARNLSNEMVSGLGE